MIGNIDIGIGILIEMRIWKDDIGGDIGVGMVIVIVVVVGNEDGIG